MNGTQLRNRPAHPGRHAGAQQRPQLQVRPDSGRRARPHPVGQHTGRVRRLPAAVLDHRGARPRAGQIPLRRLRRAEIHRGSTGKPAVRDGLAQIRHLLPSEAGTTGGLPRAAPLPDRHARHHVRCAVRRDCRPPLRHRQLLCGQHHRRGPGHPRGVPSAGTRHADDHPFHGLCQK